MHTLLQVLLFIHLAGLIMGFIGGRSHSSIMKSLPDTGQEASGILWDFEKKASWIAFVGTMILIPSGIGLLWLKWGGIQTQPPLFWLKLCLVAVVAYAEIARHQAAIRWRCGEQKMHAKALLWGKISGISAVAIIILAIILFN